MPRYPAAEAGEETVRERPSVLPVHPSKVNVQGTVAILPNLAQNLVRSAPHAWPGFPQLYLKLHTPPLRNNVFQNVFQKEAIFIAVLQA